MHGKYFWFRRIVFRNLDFGAHDRRLVKNPCKSEIDSTNRNKKTEMVEPPAMSCLP